MNQVPLAGPNYVANAETIWGRQCRSIRRKYSPGLRYLPKKNTSQCSCTSFLVTTCTAWTAFKALLPSLTQRRNSISSSMYHRGKDIELHLPTTATWNGKKSLTIWFFEYKQDGPWERGSVVLKMAIWKGYFALWKVVVAYPCLAIMRLMTTISSLVPDMSTFRCNHNEDSATEPKYTTGHPRYKPTKFGLELAAHLQDIDENGTPVLRNVHGMAELEWRNCIHETAAKSSPLNSLKLSSDT